MQSNYFSHRFPMFPVSQDIEPISPPEGTEASCGFRVPKGWQPRPHDPELDLTCPECVRRERLYYQSRDRALMSFQQKVSVRVW